MRTLNKDKIIKIEEYINVFSQRNGCAPFLEDISSGTGIPLTTVHRYIKYMENIGMLEHDRRRGIRTKEMKDEGEMISVPVLGKVSCGEPKFAEENIEEYVKLPVTLFGSGDYFLLRANGYSMIDAGIDNGDLVLVRQQNYADAGQIVGIPSLKTGGSDFIPRIARWRIYIWRAVLFKGLLLRLLRT